MADVIRVSQEQFSRKKLVDGHRPVDPMFSRDLHTTIAAPHSMDVKRVAFTGTITLGEENQVDVPKTGYLGDLSLDITLADTAGGTYVDYVGIAMIDRVRIESGGNTIWESDYADAIQALVFDGLEEEHVNDLLAAAGGAASGSPGSVSVIIPTFWSSLMHNRVNQQKRPLWTRPLADKMRLFVTFKSLADILDAGATGGGASNVQLVYRKFDTTSELRRAHDKLANEYTYKSVDLVSLSGQVVADATETAIDVSGLTGDLIRLNTLSRSATDLAAKNYLNLTALDAIRSDLDGSEYWRQTSANGSLLEDLISHGQRRAHSTLGRTQEIPFAVDAGVNKRHNFGSLNTNAIANHQLFLTHSAGENVTVSVLGLRHAKWFYEDGSLVRRR